MPRSDALRRVADALPPLHRPADAAAAAKPPVPAAATACPRPLLLVTRPQPQADAWVARLRALGQPAAAWPLLAITPLADSRAVAAAWQGLAGCGLVMFVSPAAVDCFFAQRPPAQCWPSGVLAGATGPGSAAALAAAGVAPADIVSPAADAPRFDSEALWELLAPRRPWAGVRVLVVRGEGGRDWLAGTLRQHGAALHFIEAYRRTMPVPDAAALGLLGEALAQPAAHAWLLSSSEAVANLQRLAPQADWSGAHALATHPRIAEAARGLGFGRVELAAPSVEAVAAALASPAGGTTPPALQSARP